MGVAEPSYSLYPVLAEIHDTAVTRVPLRDDWSRSLVLAAWATVPWDEVGDGWVQLAPSPECWRGHLVEVARALAATMTT